MKYIDAKGKFVEEGSPESAYQVDPDSADGQRLIASLRGEKLDEPIVTTTVAPVAAKPVKTPEVVEEVKPKAKAKK